MFFFLLRTLLLIVSSMCFIWQITHFRLCKLRLLLTLELYILYLNIRHKWFTKRKLCSETSVKPKMALFGFKTGNATFSKRCKWSRFRKFCAYLIFSNRSRGFYLFFVFFSAVSIWGRLLFEGSFYLPQFSVGNSSDGTV